MGAMPIAQVPSPPRAVRHEAGRSAIIIHSVHKVEPDDSLVQLARAIARGLARAEYEMSNTGRPSQFKN
jgi:hypothetical protein